MLNAEKLVYQLLTLGLLGTPDAGMRVTPDIDVNAIDELPLLTYHVSGGAEVENSSEPPMAWNFSLSLTLFDEDIATAGERAGRVYDVVHAWNDPWGGKGLIGGVGGATDVSDDSIFTRTATVDIDGRGITQMDAGFGLVLFKS